MNRADWPPCGRPGPLGTVLLGLAVLADEIRWLARAGLHRLETLPLRRRLRAETLALGQAMAAGQEHAELLRRVRFLQTETAALDGRLADARRRFEALRRQTLRG